MLDACRILDHCSLVHGYGHVSARAPGGMSILITPRRAPALVRSPEEIIELHLDGKLAQKRVQSRQKRIPPLELFLHTEIYRARPDVNAICRTHGKFALTLSVLRRNVRPLHELAAGLGREVPLFDCAELIASAEMGRRVAEALGASAALLMRGNGALTVGASVQEAVVNAVYLETAAELQWRAEALGEPAWLSSEEFQRLSKREYESVLRPWEYYRAKSRKG